MTQLLVDVKAGTIQQILSEAKVTVQPGDILCYKVQKKEEVSAAKVIALIPDSGVTGRIVGDKARKRLGLPISGKASVQPSNVPAAFTLFVQSTSHNRKIPAGSSILVLREGAASVEPTVASPKKRSIQTPAEAHPAKKARVEPSPAVSLKQAAEACPGASSKPSAVPTSPLWQATDSVSFRNYGSINSERVAAFDMDSTLISTRSGKTFPTSKDDWVLWAGEVKTKLQTLHRDKTKLVIITNQGGIEKGMTKLSDIQLKIDALQKELAVPLLAMILTKEDVYRKPLPGSWRLMEAQQNGGIKVSSAQSIYVGDAAGRVPPVVRKKDFSDNDLKFALNVGVQFQTPEEFFLGKDQKYERDNFEFDPRRLGMNPKAFPVSKLKGQVLVLTVGAPGSGKSAAATSHFKSFVRVNQDTLKTKEKCHKVCEDALNAGKSVVVDNQNKGKADRAPYLAKAKAVGATAIALRYDVPKELCFHLNTYRKLNTSSEHHRAEKVPTMVIHSFYNKVEEPQVAEGFATVYRMGLEHFALTEDANIPLMRSFM